MTRLEAAATPSLTKVISDLQMYLEDDDCLPGYEWDVGIHYIGEMGRQTLNKTLLDQISCGQIEWAPLNNEFDVVQIG